MRSITDLNQWGQIRLDLIGSVGFVPTMGALHEGHLSLLRRSIAENDQTILSIFVNATQFNNSGDLESYPSDLANDLSLAKSVGVDWVLIPDYDQIYSDGFRFRVREQIFSQELCGADRPDHFDGVLTVVLKLLQLTRPGKAYFGLKDFQQYLLIKDMCAALFLSTEIVGCETQREDDGLAMSSRNQRLDCNARALAGRFNKVLYQALTDDEARRALDQMGARVAYIKTQYGRRFGAIEIAAESGSIRLIDNLIPMVLESKVDVDDALPGTENRLRGS
jgi:pantoate--beta-alanine ligase